MHKHTSLRSSFLLPIAVFACLLCGGVSGAAAASDIEAVWSFNGGAVAVKGLSDGTFQGTVVTPTTFANCAHPVGQVMWTNMRLQADGSYWGLHQWYNEGPTCEADSVLGLTAWRVLEVPGGGHVLKVCFNKPVRNSNEEAVQPTIAPDGTEAHVTYGCTHSELLGPVPRTSGEGGSGGVSGAVSFSNTVTLPPTKACVSRTSLKIKFVEPRFDPLREVVVKVGGKIVARVKGVKRVKRGVTLRNLPAGTFKVSVTAVTVLNQRLTGSRTYRSCSKGSGKFVLHRKKKHHRH